MIDKNTAFDKVSLFVAERIAPRPGDEVMVSFLDETEDAWIFFWESKKWIETKDRAYQMVGPRRIRVDKATGEISVMIANLE